MAVKVGQTAPDFTLYDADRNQRTLSEFKGKNVVLAFFPGTFTAPCTDEMCALRDRVEEFNSLNAQVLGISVDSPFSQKGWAEQHGLNFPILSDFDRQVVNQYGVTFQNLAGLEGYVCANRAVFVLDRNGVVHYKWEAPEPGTLPTLDEIQQALERLST